jgi:single-strand DNA-binding protein
MSSFVTQGKVVDIMNEQQVSEKFRKREFAIEIPDGSYTQTIKFQTTQDKCDLLNSISVGDEVNVTFNLTGKPFIKDGNTMYFTNLQAWRVERLSHGSSNSSPAEEAPAFYSSNTDDDLPF